MWLSMAANKLSLRVVCAAGVVFHEDVESVYLRGTDGEFELLPYHAPMVASLAESDINIAGRNTLPVKGGVVMFRDNACTIVAEMQNGFNQEIKAWD